jgi:hypothetical protein
VLLHRGRAQRHPDLNLLQKMSVHRIPKWLEELDFTLVHLAPPVERPRFRIHIYPKTSAPLQGFGNSIAQAAKDAINQAKA